MSPVLPFHPHNATLCLVATDHVSRWARIGAVGVREGRERREGGRGGECAGVKGEGGCTPCRGSWWRCA
eukprot:1433735-Rhodomonas_salina.2